MGRGQWNVLTQFECCQPLPAPPQARQDLRHLSPTPHLSYFDLPPVAVSVANSYSAIENPALLWAVTCWTSRGKTIDQADTHTHFRDQANRNDLYECFGYTFRLYQVAGARSSTTKLPPGFTLLETKVHSFCFFGLYSTTK